MSDYSDQIANSSLIEERRTLSFHIDIWEGFKSACISVYCNTDGQKASMRNRFEAMERIGDTQTKS